MSHRVSAKQAILLGVVSSLALMCSPSKPAENGAPPGPSEPGGEVDAPAATPSNETPLPAEPGGTESPAAQPEAPAAQTLFVDAKRKDCQGEAPMKCLQVRESPDQPWRNFFGRIEGFEYEEGNSYELRVEVTPVAAPAADAPSLRYRLIEVVEKRKGEGGVER
jgi:hypothetical protein